MDTKQAGNVLSKKRCGCQIHYGAKVGGYTDSIAYCPLHAAAPALLQALKRQATEWHNDNCPTTDIEKCSHSKCLEDTRLIATAEGR